MEAMECEFVRTDTIFIDATHIKASANKNKYIKKMAEQRAIKYKRKLLNEINTKRKAKKNYSSCPTKDQ
ncbi:hypothetical protein [Calorimonas adulescens]|jgi:hypothetical protein|nr:hypothetical protein [Calorimonas adulescens]